MSRKQLQNAAVFALLVSAGVGLRIAFQSLPNFAPVAALALFAGFYFRTAAIAIAVPLLVMAISDRVIGGYDGAVMFAVYASLSLPVAMRWIVRRYTDLGSNRLSAAIRSGATILSCSLIASLLFFVATNFAVWSFSELYTNSWAGLTACFTQALPFFRYTVTGDVIFATALFGSYAFCLRFANSSRSVVATQS